MWNADTLLATVWPLSILRFERGVRHQRSRPEACTSLEQAGEGVAALALLVCPPIPLFDGFFQRRRLGASSPAEDVCSVAAGSADAVGSFFPAVGSIVDTWSSPWADLRAFRKALSSFSVILRYASDVDRVPV